MPENVTVLSRHRVVIGKAVSLYTRRYRCTMRNPLLKLANKTDMSEFASGTVSFPPFI